MGERTSGTESQARLVDHLGDDHLRVSRPATIIPAMPSVVEPLEQVPRLCDAKADASPMTVPMKARYFMKFPNLSDKRSGCTRCKEFGGRTWLSVGLGWPAFLLVTLSVASPALLRASPVAGEIRLAGGEHILWLIERHRLDTAKIAMGIAYRRSGPTPEQRFYPLIPAGSVSGRIVQAVVREEGLHAFYRDGSHWRYTAPPPGPWQVQARPDQVEVSLPHGTVPIALCVDFKSQLLFAVVPTRIANLLIAQQRRDALRAAAAAAEEGETDVSQDKPALSPPQDFDTDLALVRYEDRRWLADRPAPKDLSRSSTPVGLLVHDGVVHLIYKQSEEKKKAMGRFVDQISQNAGGSWSKAMDVPVNGELSMMATGWEADQPRLAIAQNTSKGLVVRLAKFADGAWTVGEPLASADNGPIYFTGRLAMAFTGPSLSVAVLADDGGIQFGTWPMEEAGHSVPLGSITSQVRPAPPAVSPSARIVLQYAVLGGILAVLFFWRRDNVVLLPMLAPNEVTAPHWKRSFALLIDIIVSLPAWLPALFILWQIDGMSWEEYRLASQRYEGTALGWYGMPTVGLVLGMYATVFEGFRGATLGKQAMGLLVKMQDGRCCSWSAAMGRNAARIVEFAFPPLALLVVMTPSKQRLGDMLARTLVVERLEHTEDQGEPDAGGRPGGDEST